MTRLLLALLLSACISAASAAFGPVSNARFGGVVARTSRSTSPTRLFGATQSASLAGLYFQVEEMEDRDSCTTEVILNANNTVTPLETNGPPFLSGTGKWNLQDDGSFEMTLERTYESGKDSKKRTDMGIFQFTTIRSFVGQLSKIGEKQGIEGSVYDLDSGTTERKVGFFEMIDTTVGEDGEASLRGGVHASS